VAHIHKRVWTASDGQKRQGWQVRYTDAGGAIRTKQFKLRREADAYLLKARGELAAGIHTPDAASITVAAAADFWIANAERRKRDRGTIKGYRETAELHLKPHIGATKLSQLTKPQVVALREKLLETTSAATAKRAIRGLSMLLSAAMEAGLVGQNVASGVKVEQPPQARAAIPPRSHIVAMFEAADELAETEPALPCMLRLAAFTGMRSSELRGLCWHDIDLAAGTVAVSRRADRWNMLGLPKSAAGSRTIPIGPAMVKALKVWKLACPVTTERLVFPNRRGNVLTQHRIIDLLTAVQAQAGLAMAEGDKVRPRYGWHDLRHAAASAWIAQRVDLKRLQVWMGHATIQLTLDTYGHLLKDAEQDAALAAGAEAALLGGG
jgi:integrase